MIHDTLTGLLTIFAMILVPYFIGLFVDDGSIASGPGTRWVSGVLFLGIIFTTLFIAWVVGQGVKEIMK